MMKKTNLSFSDSRKKTPTYYFRHSFSLPEGAKALSTRLLFKRDDAAAHYTSTVQKSFEITTSLTNAGHHDNYATANVPEENTFIEAQFDLHYFCPVIT